MTGKYKLDELARRAGVSPRTVRYYVQRGLIAAPTFHGKDTAYGDEHLARLRAIRRLQDAFFPLDAIAIELEGKSLEEIERIASGAVPAVALPPPSAPEPSGGRQMLEVAPSVSPRSGQSFRRVELAPGLELTIADDAPIASRKLYERFLNEVRGGDR